VGWKSVPSADREFSRALPRHKKNPGLQCHRGFHGWTCQGPELNFYVTRLSPKQKCRPAIRCSSPASPPVPRPGPTRRPSPATVAARPRGEPSCRTSVQFRGLIDLDRGRQGSSRPGSERALAADPQPKTGPKVASPSASGQVASHGQVVANSIVAWPGRRGSYTAPVARNPDPAVIPHRQLIRVPSRTPADTGNPRTRRTRRQCRN
jgi:hypothetical protein